MMSLRSGYLINALLLIPTYVSNSGSYQFENLNCNALVRLFNVRQQDNSRNLIARILLIYHHQPRFYVSWHLQFSKVNKCVTIFLSIFTVHIDNNFGNPLRYPYNGFTTTTTTTISFSQLMLHHILQPQHFTSLYIMNKHSNFQCNF